MDRNTLIGVAVVAVMLVVIVLLLVRTRTPGRVAIKGPLGSAVDFQGTSVDISDAKAGRDLVADDQAGGGVKIKGVEAGQDVKATSSRRP